MATIGMWLNVKGNELVPALEQAVGKLDEADGELVLNFGSVRQVPSSAVHAMHGLASAAEGKGVRVVLRDVNVDVYKVLKLVKLAPRFSFASSGHHGITELERRHAEPSAK